MNKSIVFLFAFLYVALTSPCAIMEISSLAEASDCTIKKLDDYTI